MKQSIEMRERWLEEKSRRVFANEQTKKSIQAENLRRLKEESLAKNVLNLTRIKQKDKIINAKELIMKAK
jgi:hypothetical protein